MQSKVFHRNILILAEGKIFVFGWNKTGQCGVSPSDLYSSSLQLPRPLPSPWMVHKVACGWNHTLAIIEGGRVTAWGCNAFGQLGIPSVDKISSVPVKLSSEVSWISVLQNGSLYPDLPLTKALHCFTVIPLLSCDRYQCWTTAFIGHYR